MFIQSMQSLVRCPKCTGHSLNVDVDDCDDKKMINGTLTCGSCNAGYELRGGVPDLVPQEVALSDEWQLWNDHLAGFDARRKQRNEKPDSFATRITHESSKLQQAFAEFTEIQQGRILDVGCGPGNFRKCFDENEVEYWGMDPLPLPETEDFPFVRAVAEFLPFADDTFSDVIVMAAMDHFQNVDKFCEETVRILKPGGRLHLLQSIHDVSGPLTAVKSVAHSVKDMMETKATTSVSAEAPKHMTEYNRKTIQEAMDRHFETRNKSKFSKKWYSPENLFLTLTPK